MTENNNKIGEKSDEKGNSGTDNEFLVPIIAEVERCPMTDNYVDMIYKLLIDSSTIPRTCVKSTVLMMAVSNGHADICQLLLEKGICDLEDKDMGGRTALMLAAIQGHTDIVELLIQYGADLAYKDPLSGQNALICSVSQNEQEAAKILLNNGANVNDCNNFGNSPLLLAAWNGHLSMCELLLDYGADMKIINKAGRTAIALAAESGHYRVCIFLVQNGAVIDDTSTHETNSPLILSAKNGYFLTCQTLLAVGANPGHKNKYGQTALHFATEKKLEKLLRDSLELSKSTLFMQCISYFKRNANSFDRGSAYDCIPVHIWQTYLSNLNWN